MPLYPCASPFFEEYRNTLTIYTSVSGAVQTPSDQTEAILLTKNNKQTVNRLSALYQALNELMLSASFATSRTIYMVQCTLRVSVAVVELSHCHGRPNTGLKRHIQADNHSAKKTPISVRY